MRPGTNPQLAAQVFSFFGVVRGIASIVGPLAASLLFDSSTEQGEDGRPDYARLVKFVGAMALASALTGIAIARVQEPARGSKSWALGQMTAR